MRTSVKKKKTRFITTLDKPEGLQRLQHADLGDHQSTLEWSATASVAAQAQGDKQEHLVAPEQSEFKVRKFGLNEKDEIDLRTH